MSYASNARPRFCFSVAMCTHNATRYLAEQLDSFVTQTRLPDELVICDDASSDSTVEQLRRFADEAPFPVRIVQNPQNLGYSRNFAQALELCTGDAIALSDQDDVWHPSKLEQLEQIFQSHEAAGGVFSNGCLMDSNSRPLPGDLWSSFGFGPSDRHRLDRGEAVEVLLQRNVVTGMAMAIRRDVRRLMLTMPAHWPHDSWLALTLASEGRLRSCPERLVTYRVHQQQQIGVPITRQEKLRFLREQGLGAYLELSRQRNVREYTREAIQYESLVAAAKTNLDLAQAWWLPMAKAKAEHARRGIGLLKLGRLHRFRTVLRYRPEYRRYSPTGMAAFWRDLVI